LPLSPFGAAGAAMFELTLPPFQGKRSGSELFYSVVKVRVFILIIQQKVIKLESKK
jgi:hypothetical protein